MRVLITGGTGFVGSHTVAAARAAGHEVRLLVRRADRIPPALGPLGVADSVDHVVGDVTDARAVAAALEGCEAVIHAAAVFDLDSRAAPAMASTNVPGARLVLDAAVAAGCDPVVHVSLTAALLRRGATATPDSPLSTVRAPYTRSKAESERVARSLQDAGAPVMIVQPGAVYGPDDPHLGDQMRRLRDVLAGRYPLWPTGGFHAVDVRDVAAVHAAVLERGRGARRYIVPGHRVDGATLFGTLRSVTGRRLPYVPVPGAVALPVAWAASTAQRVLPFRLPLEYEGALACAYDTRYDDRRAREDLGVHPRPLATTFGDAVRWLHGAGHVTARQAGVAAST